MSSRKINAVTSLIVTFMLLDHAIFNAVWMLSKGAVPKLAGIMPWALTVLVALHAYISVEMGISADSEKKVTNYNKYPKLNRGTFIQRISGILMIVFSGLHIAGAMKYLQPPKIVHGILPPLFFTVVMAHVVVSANKAFITLGIGSAKFIKAVDIATKILCAVVLIADIVGFYLYVW